LFVPQIFNVWETQNRIQSTFLLVFILKREQGGQDRRELVGIRRSKFSTHCIILGNVLEFFWFFPPERSYLSTPLNHNHKAHLTSFLLWKAFLYYFNLFLFFSYSRLPYLHIKHIFAKYFILCSSSLCPSLV
jgi:hypothetical protein